MLERDSLRILANEQIRSKKRIDHIEYNFNQFQLYNQTLRVIVFISVWCIVYIL